MCIPNSARVALILALVVGSTFLAFREPAHAAVDVGTTTVDEVAAALSAGGVHVYDANSAKQYASAHVPGAVHLPFDEVRVERLPADKGAKVIFYCWNEVCSASHEAATQAAKLGFTNVSVMRAGINGWIKAGQPVEAETTGRTKK